MPKIRQKIGKKINSGFTIIEMLVGLGIFAILAAGVLGVFTVLTRTVKLAREKTALSSLASDYLEIVRNMSYNTVGTISGNPNGPLADFSNPITAQIEAFTYKIFYEVTYVDDPADGTIALGTDPAPADYKQVKMSVMNVGNGQVTDFFTSVVPKGLEGTANAGAIKIKVFNFNGQRVGGANIHIERPAVSPTMILDRTSDVNGEWIEVGLPQDTNNYHLVVTKTGYSTDQTYPLSVTNPNPINPDATVVNGVVTEINFFIDIVSNLTIKTLNDLCADVSGVQMNVRGEKPIGTTPVVYKYNQDHTSVSGAVTLSNIEWDTYTPTLLTGQSWVMRGTSPIQKVNVLPGASQTLTMVLGTNSTLNSLFVIVKDAGTGTALEGAVVHLEKGGIDYYQVTGGSIWLQSDFSGGSGQTNWSTTTPTRYFQDDGNIDVTGTPSGVRLKQTAGDYAPTGWLESSTFDTGTSLSNFSTISWEPTTQAASTTLAFQLAASNNPAGPWTYLGPDGTAGTFYTVSGNNISTALDSNRYLRYKAYLATTDPAETPIITAISINYVSGCFTPGQVYFGDLASGSYNLDVTLAGYATSIDNGLNVNGNQSWEVLMSP